MVFSGDSEIVDIAVHRTGNKQLEEELFLSGSSLHPDEKMKDLLLHYFLLPFKTDLFYHFSSEEEGLAKNPVYRAVSDIFDDPGRLYEQSLILARYLYDHSTHPHIKGGEFYTVYFKDCILEDEIVDVIGLFKSENKDTFLKVEPDGSGITLKYDQGINIHKLDKGCLIFNTEKESGYKVAVIDQTNRSSEARYWTEGFLHVSQRKDGYYHTKEILSVCKNYITEELPRQFDVSKADQADLLNRSVKFFKENDHFDMDTFTSEVMEQPEVIDDFARYKRDYQEEQEVEIADCFAISEPALKKQGRVFKSVIKLDKNFHIYVHGNRELIQQGVDENGRKYYKIFYKEEN